MSYKAAIAFLIPIISFSTSFSQVTYFVKYKNYVSRSSISAKIQSRQFFGRSALPALTKTNFSASYFARDLGSDDSNLSRIVKLTFADKSSAQSFIDQIKNDPSVDYVQQSNIYKIDSMPNDSLASEQWALQKIKAFDAWNITEGSDSIIIGLIDTGVDYLHPDLKNKIYINPGETGMDRNGNDKKSNGIDDDGNGFIDDYMGWDFTDRSGFPYDSTSGDYLNWDNNPMDDNGHGTYIAGIIAAETDNLIGIAGAAPKVRILNLRAFDPSGYGEEDDVAAAILYAVKMGAKVINMSFGDTQFSYVLRDVIRYAYSKGVVLVASSGNSGTDEPHYPSGYSEVICVGNSTENDEVNPTSNYGSTLDLVAPGTDILTTSLGGGYSVVSGTSASAPFVSATAGLLLSIGNFTNEEVKQILKTTADDIGQPGWDIYSGAGRLNMFKAVSAAAPSIMKFDYPYKNFSTKYDTLSITATILSPYFQSYSLYVGTGLTPNSWTTLISNSQYQFENKKLLSLDISSFKDTVYCLRLAVNLNNGMTTEERLNFNIIRKSADVALEFAGPAYYGDGTTILASMYTDQPCVVKMFYKKSGAAQYNFVTLDGFATNTEMVTNLHYGFIPQKLVEQNSSYNVYFEIDNMVGLDTILNNNGKDFQFRTDFPLNLSYSTEEPFTLPAGEIYKNPVSFTSNDSNEVILREDSNPTTSYFYRLNGNTFLKYDSLQNQIVKDVGDFNNNGRQDILSYLVYAGYIFEQDGVNSKKFAQKFADTTGKFWPVMAKDIDNDGTTELLELNSDTSFVIWKIQNSLSLNSPVQLNNFTQKGPGENILDSPHAVISDINSKKEIWMVDEDGDIFSYYILGSGSYQKGRVIATGFQGSSSLLAAGSYLGDGSTELAVLLHSIENTDIAPYYRLVIFRLTSDSINTIYDQAILDPTTEFNSQFHQAETSLRFADVDNDGRDELIVFDYPYSYILKSVNGQNEIISYKENINSGSVFVGDLNKNGVPDIAFPTNSGIKFFEFSPSNYASTPYNLTGYSVDSTRIKITWAGIGNKFVIYKGTNGNNLNLYDSTASNTYIDTNVIPATNYYFGVKAYDSSKLNPLSNLSQTVEVYSHSPAEVIAVDAVSSNNLLVTFSNRVSNKIDYLNSFELNNIGYPNSISAASQFSYLLNFTKEFPSGRNTLIISNLTDYYGSPTSGDTIGFNVSSTITQNNFYISGFQIINPKKVAITFNLDVDSVAAVNLSNYILTPDNRITSVRFNDQDKKTIYLNFDGQKPIGSIGIEYKLHIINLVSSTGTGNVKIGSGAGSFVVLTSYAENLSDVYVYPNPARILSGDSKITFANLPKRVKISIFNLSGKMINQIQETSGDGGLDYNLRDESGNFIPSGIYIFRIEKLDDSNQEVEVKLGKFAVIR